MRQIAALAILLALFSLPKAAQAEEWCGFRDKEGFAVRCGFSSLAECKHVIGGKDAICIPDPTFAARKRRITLAANRE